jgi:hypothetical protein
LCIACATSSPAGDGGGGGWRRGAKEGREGGRERSRRESVRWQTWWRTPSDGLTVPAQSCAEPTHRERKKKKSKSVRETHDRSQQPWKITEIGCHSWCTANCNMRNTDNKHARLASDSMQG